MREMNENTRALARELAAECATTEDITGLLKKLFGETIEEMLEAEMDMHLGYTKNSIEGNNTGNSRNGYGKKTLKSEWGEQEINIPRDRNGEYEPKIIAKRQTRTNEIEKRVLALYSKGMSVRDINDQLYEIYGADISPALISGITDKILPMVTEWQTRPLEEVYPIMYFDGVWFKKKKDSKVVKTCVYSVLGINSEGRKEILGIWDSESESATFWATVFNDLKNRGVRDIFIACHDNLTGFANALETVFPKTENQLCVIHMIRNSTKYVSYKDIKTIMADLKKIYSAVNEEAALFALEELREKWGAKYPQMLKVWDGNWENVSTFFKYPEEVRRLIYTTNAVEGFHRMLRKYTKTKVIYPTDDALRKSIYLSVQEISKKWTQPIQNWGIIIGQFMIFFGDRLETLRSA
jgi:putative transposase